jgi:hypothetical protein
MLTALAGAILTVCGVVPGAVDRMGLASAAIYNKRAGNNIYFIITA